MKKTVLCAGNVVYVTPSSLPVFLPRKGICALDCEGFRLGAEGKLCLLQIAFSTGVTFLFDVHAFAPQIPLSASSSSAAVASVSSALSSPSLSTSPSGLPLYLVDFLEDPFVTKLVHDARNDAAALFHQHNVQIKGVLDTQLFYEYCSLGTPFASLDMVLQKYHPNCTEHPSKKWAKNKILLDPEMWVRRPLESKLIEYAVSDVKLLVECETNIQKILEVQPSAAVTGWSLLLSASERRCRDAERHSALGRRMCFLSPTSVLASQELGAVLHQEKIPRELKINTDLDQLLKLLPANFLRDGKLGDMAPTFKLRDIVLDLGKRPYAFFGSERTFLCEEQSILVTKDDIQQVVNGLGAGGFGPDNRAGIDGCLHRISAIKNLQRSVIGLTLRIGRSVPGNADMISDLILGSDMPSVLILGVPGTGKTTIVREIARLLAERQNVCVVDTSNEICGDGDVPHTCTGFARRMMVPKIEEQSKVMVECLQNHTPDVILIDEIGRRPEVDAARTVKQRGVRLVASAHGDLRGLVKNHQLNGLVGGLETVTLGDEAAKKNGSKLQAARQGAPVFDAVVELQKDDLNSWRVVKDVAAAVDCIIAGKPYNAQKRSRADGNLRVQLERVEV